MSNATCRKMKREDLEAVGPLMGQLGYGISSEGLAVRFDSIQAETDHFLVVAEKDGDVIGFLHAYSRPALEKPPEVIIQAMAVEQTARRGGIGRLLLAEAESWARGQGYSSIALHSQTKRADAHAFYEQLGFREAATSALLRKAL